MSHLLARIVKLSDHAWLVQSFFTEPPGQYLALTSKTYRDAGYCNRYCWAPFPAGDAVPPDRPRVLVSTSEDGARGAFARQLLDPTPGMQGEVFESGYTVERAGAMADELPVVESRALMREEMGL